MDPSVLPISIPTPHQTLPEIQTISKSQGKIIFQTIKHSNSSQVASPSKTSSEQTSKRENYRKQLEEWLKTQYQEFSTFLEYKNRRPVFKINEGLGFYFDPRKKEIGIDLFEYIDVMESGIFTINQFYGTILHEFSHIKRML